MKKTRTLILLILVTLNSYLLAGGQSEVDNDRIIFINQMAEYINEYFDKKGYYPFASGKYNLPVCIYFSSSMEEVDYPVHYNNVTVFDYSIFIKELKNVLGPAIDIESDPIESHKDGRKYIAKYYAAGNSYLLTANLFNGNKFTTHNRFNSPEGGKIANQSKINKFVFNPGFMHRYSIGNITNADHFTFSHSDYNKIVKSNYEVEERDENLINAINSSNYEEVIRLINSGVSINPIHRNFNMVTSPLIFSVKNNDIKMVKLLLENGANVNARGSYQDVVLIYALSSQEVNIDMVKLLVEYGANVNIPNFFAYSPFTGVCKTGNVEIAKLFIDNGANLNQDFYYSNDDKYKLGSSPIKAAISNNHYDIVKILIDNKCKLDNGTLGDPQTPLEYAEELGDEKMISLIKENLN